jgi:regulator of protease activity HflC (stomatin/prohibitin superfamily)
MATPVILVGALGIVLILVLVGLTLLRATRVVGPEERLVVYRMGRSSAALVHGPGRVLLLPLLDRGIVVDMAERRLAFDGLTATTRDAHQIEADVSVRLRVTDPRSVTDAVIDLPDALRGLLAFQLATTAADLSHEALLHGSVLDDALWRTAEEALTRWGAVCVGCQVERLEPGT